MNERMGALKWLLVPALFGLYFVAVRTSEPPSAPQLAHDHDGDGKDDHGAGEHDAAPRNAVAPKPSGTASASQTALAKSATKTGGAKPGAASKGTKMQELEGGLKIDDTQVGTGKEAKSGDRVTVNYRGSLENGTVFDESYKRGEPFPFTLGQGAVIKGWDVGVAGMKEGGKRKLFIPSEMGYGSRGAGGVIPPNANLIFEVELLKVG